MSELASAGGGLLAADAADAIACVAKLTLGELPPFSAHVVCAVRRAQQVQCSAVPDDVNSQL